MDRQAIREGAWKRLQAIAYPDSRYHLDFAEFIPGYPGCEDAPRALSTLPAYTGSSGVAFITPDGSTEPVREFLIRMGRPVLTATHGGRRGFRFLPHGSVPLVHAGFAATLDGAERFGRQITTTDGLRELGRLDFLVTGASAVSVNGVRFGKGHGYFDIEWGIFTELGMASEDTPVVVVVHDVQVTDEDLPACPEDTAGDWIITPTRTLRVIRQRPKPHGIKWEQIDPAAVEANPVLRDMLSRTPAGDTA